MNETTVRVGMAQTLVEPGRCAANLDRATAAILRAARLGCRVVVLPECLDVGWTDPSARDLAQAIPGPHFERLARAAGEGGLYVVAGLVERARIRLYNAAVLIGPTGDLLLHHRKINEFEIALDLYSVGQRLAVAETEFGVVGLAICADNFPDSAAIGHVLARMGARMILSPCSWAVEAGHDQQREPYGALWERAYGELSRLYDLSVIGVSHVGAIEGGPWKGRKVIGCSMAVGPGGTVLGRGPYGEDAESLIVVEVPRSPSPARGTGFAGMLRSRGYEGP